ncbi:MAG TPA: hemolysin family protein [Candidatus Krumholzibacteria bacterium]|nr:hemolysin family protein [Candidatus Krumholzibacteria bacterium]
METGLAVGLYVVSVALLSAYTAALTALSVISLHGIEQSEESKPDWLVARADDEPVNTGLALGMARALASLFVIVSAVALVHEAGAVGAGVFAAASVLLPAFAARALALEGAARLVRIVSPVAVPTVYALRPAARLAARVLSRAAPALPALFAFDVIPLAEKIELMGDGDGGTAEEEERRIMSSIADFGETRARDVMVPRIDIVAVDAAMDREEALAAIMDAGHSRIPVYERSIDHVIGTLHTQDLLVKVLAGEEFSIRNLARDAFFVPESKKITELLAEFKVRRQHLSIVVDEYGGTAGIVTLEDVIEELVGDIRDEFDSEEDLVRRLDRDSALVSARIHIEELNEVLGLALPDENADTLGGLLYHVIGRVPKVGDRWSHHKVEFEVQTVERQRVMRVLLTGLSSVERMTAEDG